MDPHMSPSRSTMSTIPTVEVTPPSDYFGYTPRTDPVQPIIPSPLDQARLSTPSRTSGHQSNRSTNEASLPSLPHPPVLSPKADIQTLKSALSVVRNHLSSLDTGIKRNISAQSVGQSPTKSREPDLLSTTRSASGIDGSRAPEFAVKDVHVSGAVLDTAKVCCVLESSLEALIEVLGMVEVGEVYGMSRSEMEGEKGLMDACMERGADAKKVMGSAVEGVKSVVEFDVKEGPSD
ncbi:hypothetical protein ONS95_014185 [Cadophora gregata]|uniref:uncharacterized protein n=1 Tax=Cadophora gregata TaxID=51156 RepID=UPI0026DB46D9|nr:uncharacterized protein ONS95_014185 [Cadophora gregata]KAK0114700.1 hypothetical protein ONS95_014185 [Cadophora gregata]